MRNWVALTFLALTSLALSDGITGPGSFPQFRSLAGLPGSGFGITPDNRLDFSGAMGVSTPVAYSLSNYQMVIIGGTYSPNRSFRFDTNQSELLSSNGTLVGMIGLNLGQYGHITGTHMVLSSKGDHAQNYHYQLPVNAGNFAFGIGCQDGAGQGGTQGETNGPRNLDPGESRTYYAVTTYDFGNGHYASLGFGDTRFKGRFFANASYQINDRLKLIGEHDVFGTNTGLAVNLGKIGSSFDGREIQATFTLGYLDFENAYWTFGVSF